MSSQSDCVGDVRRWVSRVVIEHNFCPFARRELEAERIAWHRVPTLSLTGGVEALLTVCQELDQSPECSNAILVFDEGFGDFEDYLDLVAVAEEALQHAGYEGIYQLASFHPQYCFEGAEPGDPANFTNRSPWPVLHLLRESALGAAIANHPNVESIPETNIAHARELGGQVFRDLLQRCCNAGD